MTRYGDEKSSYIVARNIALGMMHERQLKMLKMKLKEMACHGARLYGKDRT